MSSAKELQAGDILGGYQIENILGRGGMGVVFKAHELSLNRKVALKVLSSRLSASPEFLKRFKREAQVIATLKHPSIVNILTLGEQGGHQFFAMEYVEGLNLRDMLKTKDHFPCEEALRIVRQIADALCEAECKGVVHRDVKPSNIMIDAAGKAYLTDFGIAFFEESSERLTQTGLFLGTPEYASPEQAKGAAVDTRSDIYSLGAVLYRMLSGQSPATADSPLAVMVKIITEPVTPVAQLNPSVPEPVCALVDKMMAKEVGQRYCSAKELVADMDHCLEQLGSTRSTALTKSLQQAVHEKRPPRRIAGLTAAAAAVVFAACLVFWLVKGQGLFKPEPAAVKHTSVESSSTMSALAPKTDKPLAVSNSEPETQMGGNQLAGQGDHPARGANQTVLSAPAKAAAEKIAAFHAVRPATKEKNLPVKQPAASPPKTTTPPVPSGNAPEVVEQLKPSISAVDPVAPASQPVQQAPAQTAKAESILRANRGGEVSGVFKVATASSLLEEEIRIPMELKLKESLFGTKTVHLVAKVYRPAKGERFPLLVLNHSAPKIAEERKKTIILKAQGMVFVKNGFAVVVPSRRGFGTSEGRYAESIGKCDEADYDRAAVEVVKDIRATIEFMKTKFYIDKEKKIIVGGIGPGGFASLAYASVYPDKVAAVLNFSGGRGSVKPYEVCRPDRLVNTVGNFGKTSKNVPTLWIYSDKDDDYLKLARDMFEDYKKKGGEAKLLQLNSDYGSSFFYRDMGTWEPIVETFLREINVIN